MAARPPRARDEGQALVEFTLVLPVFVVLVLAIAQFGVAFHHYLVLTDAVRAGARVASVSATAPDPEGAATDAVLAAAGDLDKSVLASRVQVQSTWESGKDVTVTASYPYSLDILGIVVKSGDLTSTITEPVD
jgi:Flp pilus assembly protein TadG